MTAEERILQVVGDATAESVRRAGPWIACRPGCSECCHAAFAITMADAVRLQHGLAAARPEVAEGIRNRAALYRKQIRDSFPGEWNSGTLTGEEQWRDWFFARRKGIACPVLDTASGKCLLYDHRPVACRIYGHLIQIGNSPPQTMCRLCFLGATGAQIEAARVHIAEDAVLQEEGSPPAGGNGNGAAHTIVALAV